MQRQQTGGRLKALIVLLFSFLVAGGATFLVFRFVRKAAAPRPMVEVVFALHDLPSGIPITPEDIKVFSIPRDGLPQSALFLPASEDAEPSAEASSGEARPTFFRSIELVVGRTPREIILTREPLRAERLADAEKGIGLNAIIGKGMRAMSVEVDSESGVAGLLKPGHRVDVIVTIQPDVVSTEAEWLSFAFLQRVQVLAVDREIKKGAETSSSRQVRENGKAGPGLLGASSQNRRDGREKPTVTLEVSPEQAELLALASSKGTLHLALRNDQDIEEPDLRPLSSADLLRLQAKPERVAAPPKASTLVYIDTKSGGNTIRSWYDDQGNKVREQVLSKTK
jgi:pilus assembly protein CpaB